MRERLQGYLSHTNMAYSAIAFCIWTWLVPAQINAARALHADPVCTEGGWVACSSAHWYVLMVAPAPRPQHRKESRTKKNKNKKDINGPAQHSTAQHHNYTYECQAYAVTR